MTEYSPESLLPEVLAFRQRFPIFRDKVHLANNAMGAICDVTEDAHRRYLDDRIRYGASWEVAIPLHEELRASFADLIGAKTHEIAACFTATQALATLASCFDFRTGRAHVVYDDYSFPSVAQLWQAQQRAGARVRRVGVDENGLILPEYFDPHLDDDVQLVSVAHVCYKNGHRLDIDGVIRRAHDVGAIVAVDDYQNCGSTVMDVKKRDIDVLVAGTVKYLLGSPGVVLMYVREELLDQLHPSVTGWFGQQDPNAMQIDAHHEAQSATRFQSGTPALSAIYDSLAGLELVKSIGIAKIQAWIEYITTRLINRLQEEGFVPATPIPQQHRGPQISIRSKDAARMVDELLKRAITSTWRDGNIRTAWHFYNTPDDIEALISALQDLRHLMVTVD